MNVHFMVYMQCGKYATKRPYSGIISSNKIAFKASTGSRPRPTNAFKWMCTYFIDKTMEN